MSQAAPSTAASSARTAKDKDSIVPAVPYGETPLGILQAMLMLPVAEAGAGPATMPASGKVCSKQSGSRQQQAVASVSPLSAFEPGYVKQHNKAVSAALSDPSVKVRSYFPNSHGQRMTQGSCATVERDPTQPNIRNMHLNSQPSFFSPAEGPPPGIQCPLVPIGPGQHRALHPHGVGGCGAQQWW